MAKQSSFDPDAVDPAAYSKDPYQHGDSDFGTPSEGVGNNVYKDSTSGIDMDDTDIETTRITRQAVDTNVPQPESIGSTQPWNVNSESIQPDVPKGQMMSDEAVEKFKQIPENPSDEALFNRADATYLEPDDDPNQGYDPHNQGYDGKPGK